MAPHSRMRKSGNAGGRKRNSEGELYVTGTDTDDEDHDITSASMDHQCSYEIKFTFPGNVLKILAVRKEDDLHMVLSRVRKFGKWLPSGNWEMILRLKQDTKESYAIGENDLDTWNAFRRLVHDKGETEVIGSFLVPSSLADNRIPSSLGSFEM